MENSLDDVVVKFGFQYFLFVKEFTLHELIFNLGRERNIGSCLLVPTHWPRVPEELLPSFSDAQSVAGLPD